MVQYIRQKFYFYLFLEIDLLLNLIDLVDFRLNIFGILEKITFRNFNIVPIVFKYQYFYFPLFLNFSLYFKINDFLWNFDLFDFYIFYRIFIILMLLDR